MTHLEVLRVVLKYPKVVTNLDFIIVTTMPLEFQGVIEVKSDIQTEYGEYIGSSIHGF